MASAGFLSLVAALAICLYGIGASLYGARSGRREYVASGRRAVYALAGVLAVAMAILQAAFVRSDFSFELVATHSSTTTPLFYRLTAVWSSQEGSLLLWVLLLAFWSSAILFLTRRRLVLHGARLGRLLGLGPGRERVADAVADRHRVPALRDDPGEARDVEGLERVARAGDGRAGDPRHVPRALRDPRVDPRVRRLDARDPVPAADRRDYRRLDRARGKPRRVAARRAPAPLPAVARGGGPAQQPPAPRALL